MTWRCRPSKYPAPSVDGYSPNIQTNNSLTEENSKTAMINNKAISINIFLLDGDPDGVRMAQITMSTIQSIAFRRSQFPRVKNAFKEINRPGVYLLLGSNPDDPDSKIAYIGESEDVAKRLQFHNSSSDKNNNKMDFWTDTIAFISKDENLTKSHARYVEAKLITAVGENKRWQLKNGQKPPEIGKLPKQDEAAMNQFIEQSKMLTGALGWDLFKFITSHQLDNLSSAGVALSETTTGPEFYFSSKTGFSATAIVFNTTGEWIVKKGSTARLEVANTIPKGAIKIRDQLLTDGILITKADGLVFNKDCSFTSPSMAACVVCGFAQNGRIAWKSADGKTYSDWEAEQVNMESAGLCEEEFTSSNSIHGLDE